FHVTGVQTCALPISYPSDADDDRDGDLEGLVGPGVLEELESEEEEEEDRGDDQGAEDAQHPDGETIVGRPGLSGRAGRFAHLILDQRRGRHVALLASFLSPTLAPGCDGSREARCVSAPPGPGSRPLGPAPSTR